MKRPRTEGESSSGTVAVTPATSAAPASVVNPAVTPQAGVQTDDLVLELSLRGNLLIQQQRRIVQLEQELQKAWLEIESLRGQIVEYEREKARSDSEKKPQTRYWTPEEHTRFLDALDKYGPKDVKAIATYVGTRNATQVRTHAQKYYLRIDREKSDSEGGIKNEGGRGDVMMHQRPEPKAPLAKPDPAVMHQRPDPKVAAVKADVAAIAAAATAAATAAAAAAAAPAAAGPSASASAAKPAASSKA